MSIIFEIFEGCSDERESMIFQAKRIKVFYEQNESKNTLSKTSNKRESMKILGQK